MRESDIIADLQDCISDLEALQSRWTIDQRTIGQPVFLGFYPDKKFYEPFVIVQRRDDLVMTMMAVSEIEESSVPLSVGEILARINQATAVLELFVDSEDKLPERIDLHPLVIEGLLIYDSLTVETLLGYNGLNEFGYEGHAVFISNEQALTPSLIIGDIRNSYLNCKPLKDRAELGKDTKLFASVESVKNSGRCLSD